MQNDSLSIAPPYSLVFILYSLNFMKYSYKWLQEHIKDPLPSWLNLGQVVTLKAFELEGKESVLKNALNDDTVFDFKILPDRAHDALSHRGMAREIAALFGLKIKVRETKTVIPDSSVPVVRVAIEDPKRCPRYIGVRVDGVTVGASQRFTEKLASVGQRSINNIVDLTNFVLFDLGQPMHAFDAAKVAGGITIRPAKAGEKMTTLDGKELTFNGTELVIADDEGVLALAGVKGGKKAEVGAETTSIIFECANFDPTSTRKTSVKHNIKTDASKRYENGVTSELAGEAIALALSELSKIHPKAKIGVASDIYPSPESKPAPVSVTLAELNGLLGSTMAEKDVEEVLGRLAYAGFTHKMKNGAYSVTPPVSRLDIRIKEDLIEEIGRHYGYDKIKAVVPPLPLGRKGLPNKRLYYANEVRNFLVKHGFSDVHTYSFAVKGEGEIEVENPIGKDRPFIRSSLLPGVRRALALNMNLHMFLESEDVKIFEVGNVFRSKGEAMHLAVGYLPGNREKTKTAARDLDGVVYTLEHDLHVNGDGAWAAEERIQCFIREIDFGELIKDLADPKHHAPLATNAEKVVYQMHSPYPFIMRDVALWVPKETKAETVKEVIRANAGELAQKIYLFDTFEKGDKKSFAFRIVLQSFERTLEDAEANAVYDRVVTALEKTNPVWMARK